MQRQPRTTKTQRRAEAAPRAIGTPPRDVCLDGKLVPSTPDNSGVLLLSMSGSEALYVPCFTTVIDLRTHLARLQICFGRIKQIDDGREFLESVPRSSGGHEVRVILDLRVMGPGLTVRFTEIKWN